jgi:hypothetical protein
MDNVEVLVSYSGEYVDTIFATLKSAIPAGNIIGQRGAPCGIRIRSLSPYVGEIRLYYPAIVFTALLSWWYGGWLSPEMPITKFELKDAKLQSGLNPCIWSRRNDNTSVEAIWFGFTSAEHYQRRELNTDTPK